MTDLLSPSASPRSHNPDIISRPYACTRCQQRKIKCDRADNCSNCARGKAECIYTDPPPSQRRKRKAPREEELLAKLEHYEQLLRSRGVDVDAALEEMKCKSALGGSNTNLPKKQRTSTAKPVEASTALKPENTVLVWEFRNGRMIAEKDGWTYVEEFFWAPGISEEFRNSHSDHLANGESLLFGCFDHKQSLKDLHPAQPMKLWRIFTDAVNSVLKIVHEPSILLYLPDAGTATKPIPENIEALLFAVYGAAVMSLSDEECMEHFGESKVVLGRKYLAATQHALSSAGILRSSNTILLQAFLLSIMTMRDFYDSRELVMLTVVAARIGTRIGLHRDGAAMGLPPLETEMRRRLFWNMLRAQIQSGRMSSTGNAHLLGMTWDTAIPLNIDDHEISATSTVLPESRVGVTSTSFCRVGAELNNLFASMKRLLLRTPGRDHPGGGRSMFEGDEEIATFEHYLEDNYLKYCDPLIPVQVLTTIMARSAICRIRLMAHHPQGRKSMPQKEKELLFENAIKVSEYEFLAYSTPSLQKFQWYLKSNFQFELFIFLIYELRKRAIDEMTDRCWTQVENLLKYHPAIVNSTENPMYVAMGKILLEAWDARRNNAEFNGQEPSFIAGLQARREATEHPERKLRSQANNMAQEQAVDGGTTSFSFDHNIPSDLLTPISSANGGDVLNEDWAYWDGVLQGFELPPADDFLNSILSDANMDDLTSSTTTFGNGTPWRD